MCIACKLTCQGGRQTLVLSEATRPAGSTRSGRRAAPETRTESSQGPPCSRLAPALHSSKLPGPLSLHSPVQLRTKPDFCSSARSVWRRCTVQGLMAARSWDLGASACPAAAGGSGGGAAGGSGGSGSAHESASSLGATAATVAATSAVEPAVPAGTGLRPVQLRRVEGAPDCGKNALSAAAAAGLLENPAAFGYRAVVVADARYGFEHAGGCIVGAHNVPLPSCLERCVQERGVGGWGTAAPRAAYLSALELGSAPTCPPPSPAATDPAVQAADGSGHRLEPHSAAHALRVLLSPRASPADEFGAPAGSRPRWRWRGQRRRL